MEKSFIHNSLYENNFWLEILKDHTNFMINSFSPMEKENIQATGNFMRRFGDQLEKVQGISDEHHSEARIDEVNNESYRMTLEFISCQQRLLDKKLNYEVMLNLTPTFLTHMIREGREFLRQLRHLKDMHKASPARESMHHNKLWLPDAAGHASFIQSALDMTEKESIETAKSYQQDFEGLFIKTYELKDMIHLEYPDLPAVYHLNEQCTLKMKSFICYLDTLEHLIVEKNILSMLVPLAPNHMRREEEYYLRKLKEAYPRLEI